MHSSLCISTSKSTDGAHRKKLAERCKEAAAQSESNIDLGAKSVLFFFDDFTAASTIRHVKDKVSTHLHVPSLCLPMRPCRDPLRMVRFESNSSTPIPTCCGCQGFTFRGGQLWDAVKVVLPVPAHKPLAKSPRPMFEPLGSNGSSSGGATWSVDHLLTHVAAQRGLP